MYTTSFLALIGAVLVSLGNSFLHAPSVPTARRQQGATTSFYATPVSTAPDQCDVAIFGGGFGGLYTALTVSRQARLRGQSLDICLVEPSDTFVFLPLLYDLTVGTASEVEVCPRYRDLLRGTGIRHVHAKLETLETLQQATISLHENNSSSLKFRAGVVAVGATPDDILASVLGAKELAQPFYTKDNARQTRKLLNRLEQVSQEHPQRIAVIGGGYGGVELAACVKRRLPTATVRLLSRSPPMQGTRAEPLVMQALGKLGVEMETTAVQRLEKDSQEENKILIYGTGGNNTTTWDAVLWTAGSVAAAPVPKGLDVLQKSAQGRLAVDATLHCIATNDRGYDDKCRLWALGDCAEIVDQEGPVLPKTAQVAMQQSETVSKNLLAELLGSKRSNKTPKASEFVYQDLGSLLTLGGPNAAVLAPQDGTLAPIFAPLLDTVGGVLGRADRVLSSTVGRNSLAQDLQITPDQLGLSLGSHGLGVESAPGTLAGTLAGSARRAVYASRMPTQQQRAVSLVSAAISTAAALAKEAADRQSKTDS